MSLLDIALFFAYIPVEVAFVGLLLYRRVWQTFPFFLSYCIWDLLSNICEYIVTSRYPSEHLQVYFAQTIIDSVLLFCVLVELAWSVLRPIRTSLPRGALVVVGALILLAGAAIWPFAALPGLAHVTWSKQWLLLTQLQQTVSILRILFFLLLAGGSQWLSIGWRDRELQVVTGLGFFSLANLAASLLQAHQSSGLQYVRLQDLAAFSFLCPLLYWLVSFTQKEAERREFTPQMQNFLLAVAGAARATRVALEDSRTGKPRKQDQR